MKNYSEAIGIDVGKEAIHIATADAANAKNYSVIELKITDPRWHEKLLDIIDIDAIIAAESTGWHYFAPIVTALKIRSATPAIYQVNGSQTGNIRRALIGKAKTDEMDARALAHIARLIAAGQAVQGVKEYMHAHSVATHNLRLLVNERRRLTKTSTRRLNQLDQLGHSIWPELIQNKNQWLNCLTAGAVTPDQISHLLAGDRPEDIHPTSWHWMKHKLSDLPSIDAEPRIVATIRRLHSDYSRIRESINEIEEEISQEIEREPFTEITTCWRTVPSINDIRIATFHVATNGQADTYTRAQFKSAVGWAAITKQSGKQDNTRRSRAGYKPAMDAIHHMTYSLLNPKNYPNNPILRYKQRGKSMASCRRKLAGILSGIARSKTECKF